MPPIAAIAASTAFDSPIAVVNAQGKGPVLLLCEHASNFIPAGYGGLGLPARDLERHIAWDIGAGAVARHLAEALDAWLILQNYSRLVIDCNRRLEHPDSIARRSEDTPIVGNRGVAPVDAERRAKSIFEPYHARIARELDERGATPTVMIFLHNIKSILNVR
jgi:predicted N-formylglutamate amidohydrolase